MLAPIEHLFGNCEFCNEKCYYVLHAKKEGKPYVPGESRPFFIKKNIKCTSN